MVKDRNDKVTRDVLINIFGWDKDKYIANSLLTEEDNNKIKENENNRLETISSQLVKHFGIKETDRFKEKLEDIFAGGGSEQINITKLYSSSLCALLFFYNVSENNELRLQINEKEIIFKDVLFEFQNAVIKNPSNVDIVLLGEKCDDENNKNVILFLESKFFEYCGDVKEEIKIAKSYSTNDVGKQIYNEKNIREIFNDNIDSVKINDIYIKLKKECYIEGIKQMISHYIGIKNLLEGNFYNEKNNLNLKKLYAFLFKGTMAEYENIKFDKKELIKKLEYTEIYLGEILFDFHKMNIINKDTFEGYFNNYSDKYTKLANILNGLEDKINKRNKIIVLSQPLTYSLFKDNKENSKYKIEHKIEDKIKEYYGLK